MKLLTYVLLLLSTTFAAGQTLTGTRHYLYLSDQRIVTLELIDTRKAILNYINIGDTYELIQAPLVVIRDSGGNVYRGHVIEVENPPDPADPFKVSDLIKPGEYRGYTILGKYEFQSPPEKAFFKVGGRVVEFEPLSAEDFDLTAARIAEMDLALKDGKEMVLQAGFRRGHGELHPAGTERAVELEKYFPDLNLLAPALLSSPQPALPPDFTALSDPVVVRVKAVVSRSGGLHNIEVVEGIDPRLDQRAVDAVRNSWRFLPAISKGEPATAELTLNVVFRRE